MRLGWFAIPGVQDGPRTLHEQMLGLGEALAEAPGSSVLDLGCAEGLIAAEFAKAGASSVYAVEVNQEAVAEARRVAVEHPQIHVRSANLNAMVRSWDVRRCDIVLALAILHKLENPAHGAKYAAACANRLLVVRLPHGSSGEIVGKHTGRRCDLKEELPAAGLRLEMETPGPRGELVQYWRRA